MKHRTNKLFLALLTAALLSVPAAASESTDGVNGSDTVSTEQAALPDGVYTPDSFSWSGGTGRLKGISCTQVTITDGHAVATVVFASSSYDMLRVAGEEYEGTTSEETSTFEIPVELNANNEIAGRTTKMSQPHWIDYTIYIGLGDSQAASADADMAEDTYEDSSAPQLTGLRYTGSLKVESAEYFRLHYYENQISLLEIDDGENMRQYLLAPEGAEIPAGLEKNMSVIQVPVEKAYVASESGLKILDKQNQTDKIAASGIKEESAVTFAGEYDSPDYKTLVRTGCRLAIMPSAILNSQKDGEDTASTVEEQLSLLKIPMLIDRSSDEKEDAGKEEWDKVFDALF